MRHLDVLKETRVALVRVQSVQSRWLRSAICMAVAVGAILSGPRVASTPGRIFTFRVVHGLRVALKPGRNWSYGNPRI